MEGGEEFDVMEHGPDVKHDVPSRGTGVCLYAGVVWAEAIICRACVRA